MEHPFLKKQFILFYVAGWLVFLALIISVLIGYYQLPVRVVILDTLINLMLFAIFGIGLWYPLEFIYQASNSYSSNLLNLIGLGIGTIGLWLFLGRVISIRYFADDFVATNYIEQSFPLKIIAGVIIFLILILIYYLIIYLKEYEEKRLAEAEYRSLAREAELNLLKYKMNPHFLFNSLNSISSLTLSVPEKAQEMILKLSEYLRYSLKSGKGHECSLEDELRNVRLYMEIEKIRFGERLRFIEQTDEACLKHKVPDMILQPLFENVIKHGVHESTESVKLEFECLVEGSFLEIRDRNNFRVSKEETLNTGTGLESVRKRLYMIYNRPDLMEIIKKDGTFEVKIRIPVKGE